MLSEEAEEFTALDVQKSCDILNQLNSSFLPSDDANELIGKFWSTVKGEVKKMNDVYVERERLCLARFNLFDFQNFMVSKPDTGDTTQCHLFQEIIREIYPYFETSQMSIVNNPRFKVEKSKTNMCQYAIYHSFCELLRDVHLLRDFVLNTFNKLNLMIQNLKEYHMNTYKIQCHNEKHDYKQEEINKIISNIDTKFRNICNVPLYNSTLLACVCTRVEVVATALLCVQNQSPPQQSAFVCFECCQLSYNMYVLRCFHRICYQCQRLLMLKNDYYDCPTCGRHSALINIDSDQPLRTFIWTHFDSSLFNDKNDSFNLIDNNDNLNLNLNLNSLTYAVPQTLLSSKSLLPNCMEGLDILDANNINNNNYSNNLNLNHNNIGNDNNHNHIDSNCNQFQYSSLDKILLNKSICEDFHANDDLPRSIDTNNNNNNNIIGENENKDEFNNISQIKNNNNNNTRDDSGHKISKKTGRVKVSCHQCKNNKDPNNLLFCKHMKWGPGKKKGNMVLKHCRKKFCAQCMSKYDHIDYIDQLFIQQHANNNNFHLHWKCPACSNTCTCAACQRKENRKNDEQLLFQQCNNENDD